MLFNHLDSLSLLKRRNVFSDIRSFDRYLINKQSIRKKLVSFIKTHRKR